MKYLIASNGQFFTREGGWTASIRNALQFSDRIEAQMVIDSLDMRVSRNRNAKTARTTDWY